MDLVTVKAIEAAAEGLAGVAVRTPLLPLSSRSEALDGPIRLKAESLQRAGVFKLRGAYTMISRLSKEERARGVLTFSAGNHGRAVAEAARLLGCRATVLMPTWARDVKLRAVRAAGAEVLQEGETSLELKERAEELMVERGAVLVPPFDHPEIIAGQGTVGLEILDDWPEVQAVLVPVGGGGLLAGVAAGIKGRRPEVGIIGVEPVGAASMYDSLAAGEPVTLSKAETVADGLVPIRPGDLTFAHAKAYADGIVLVEDEAIVEATLWLFRECRLVVEPSGAATVAALRSGAFDPEGRKTVAVLSGGNVSIEELRALKR